MLDGVFNCLAVCQPAWSENNNVNLSACCIDNSSRKIFIVIVFVKGKIKLTICPSKGLTAAKAYVYSWVVWHIMVGRGALAFNPTLFRLANKPKTGFVHKHDVCIFLAYPAISNSLATISLKFF